MLPAGIFCTFTTAKSKQRLIFAVMDILSFPVNTPLEDVVAKIPGACPLFGFSLLHQYDFYNILEEKGFPVARHARVFEICQARVAAVIVTHDPVLSVLMPCRFSVYEENGNTHICTQNLSSWIAQYALHPDVGHELKAVWENILALLSFLASNKLTP